MSEARTSETNVCPHGYDRRVTWCVWCEDPARMTGAAQVGPAPITTNISARSLAEEAHTFGRQQPSKLHDAGSNPVERANLDSRTSNQEVLRTALREARQVIVTACGTKAPYARIAIEHIDAALQTSWQPSETTGHCIDCIELKNALAAAVKVANEARECHDRDQDMRTMKLLIALSGHRPKWRADTDRIHDVLRRAVERLSAPMPPEEPKSPHNDVDHLMSALVQQEGVLNECEQLLRQALDEGGVDAGFDERLKDYWASSESLSDWRTRDLALSVPAEKSRAPLRDSDAAFNLGVLPTEQPEKASELATVRALGTTIDPENGKGDV